MTSSDDIKMGKRRLEQLKDEIDHFYASYMQSLSVVELNFQGELHKYACIRLSGFLEQVFHTAIYSHVKASSSPTASAFALSFWKKSPNLTPDALERLIKRFDSQEIGGSFKALIDESNILERLGTLLKVRNDSSHGKSYSGTMANVTSHKGTVDDLYKWVLVNLL